ncbi:integral membrane sensor signal transduction histidine kinase [Rhodopirellula sallentina SM41]|uniref:Integral membrane sensor signal transduction histidine kinase n=1 Tax=Rhodopirellula sallentina SM41 TaxID=1263870 RepID=M5TU62_9BACT|nr:integral membrane sensor signal transduction histidine kinase [Rhodopirellula sallentina SM41]
MIASEFGLLPRSRSVLYLSFLSCVAALVTLFVSAQRSVHARDPLPLLQDVASVRRLSDAEANQQYPIEMRGVVLFASPSSFIFHDGESSIWCSKPWTPDGEKQTELDAGMVVEIQGNTNRGHSAPVIDCSRVGIVGEDELPRPRESTLAELQAGTLDCQWVTIDGVGIKATRGNFLGMPGTSIVVSTFGGELIFNTTALPPEKMQDVIDAEISITGVCMPRFNNRGEILDSDIMSCVVGGLVVTKEASESPFHCPEVSLENLFEFSPEWSPIHRKVVEGTVTACQPGQQVFITDGVHNLRVIPQVTQPYAIGEKIQCAGFLGMQSNFPVLRTSVIRSLGMGEPPAPARVTPESVLSLQLPLPNSRQPDYEAALIRISGELVAIEDRVEKPFQIILDSDGSIVPVILASFQPPRYLREIRLGSTIEVTGICSIRTTNRPERNRALEAESFEILLRSPLDVSVVAAASWWTAARLLYLLVWAGVLLVGAILVILWMRHRISQRGQQLAEAIRAKDSLELVTETTKRERTRVAADLHDTLEQSLAGVALQLRAIETAGSDELAQRNLSLAGQILAQSREDLRRSVWNLRMTDEEGAKLREELKKACESIFSQTKISATVDGRGVERKLGVLTTDNLLMIAKEAMTNALKHARPTEIRVSVDYEPDSVCVSVTDNGCGFDSDRVAGALQGHFGLTGIKERAIRIGGELSVESSPNEGTRVTVSVRG